MEQFSKSIAQNYVFSGHIRNFSTWASPEDLICEVIAGALCYGSIALRDSQLLDSRGFYELCNPDNKWRPLFEQIVRSQYKDRPRVVCLFRDPISNATSFDALLETIAFWINRNDPLMALNQQTPSRLLGDKGYDQVCSASSPSEVIRRFSENLPKLYSQYFGSLVNALTSGTIQSILPTGYAISFEGLDQFGQRFLESAYKIDWEKVKQNEQSYGNYMDIGRLHELLESVKIETSAPSAIATVGYDFVSQEHKYLESHYLVDLAVRTYITAVPQTYDMDSIHNSIPYSIPTGDQNPALRTEYALASLYTHMVERPVYQFDRSQLFDVIAAAVQVICEHEDDQVLKPIGSDLFSDETTQRLVTFRRLVAEKVAASRGGQAMQDCELLIEKISKHLRNLENVADPLIFCVILGMAFSHSDFSQAFRLPLMTKGGSKLLRMLLEPYRFETGLSYGSVVTSIEKRQIMNQLVQCYPDIWQFVRAVNGQQRQHPETKVINGFVTGK